MEPWGDFPSSPFEQALLLQSTIIDAVTGKTLNEEVYGTLRQVFIKDTQLRGLLPDYVRTCRDGPQLWAYFKSVAYGPGSWAERRQHVYEGFARLLEHLEVGNAAPADHTISEALASFDLEGVHAAWQRALARRSDDPEGAITAARTLLETVCKHILDEAQAPYSDSDDLPKLYRVTSTLLNLAPDQHTEESFRAILGSCHTVVQHLGTLRSRIGDAHGRGRRAVRPAARHAALAVNLAGTMATFLVETWQARPDS